MSIYQHTTKWMGLPVELFEPRGKHNFGNVIYRVSMFSDGGGLFRKAKEITGNEILADFLGRPGCGESRALVLGMTNYGESIVPMLQVLCEHKGKLANLKGLFISDIISDENEISWIEPVDVTQVLIDFPGLEGLRLRSAHWFKGTRHLCLRSLIIESGGMGTECIDGIVNSVFPELEHLELWLGTENYGSNVGASEIEPLLEKGRFPKLRSLGLRNSDHSDEVAQAIASSSIVGQLESLDLSMGTLGDEGMEALLENPDLASLKSLDLHYHYLSDEIVERVHATVRDANTHRDHAEEDEGERFVAVGE